MILRKVSNYFYHRGMIKVRPNLGTCRLLQLIEQLSSLIIYQLLSNINCRSVESHPLCRVENRIVTQWHRHPRRKIDK